MQGRRIIEKTVIFAGETLLSLMFLTASTQAQAGFPAIHPQVVITQPAMMRDGKIMVPFRSVFQAFGAKVKYYPRLRQAAASGPALRVLVRANSNLAVVDGQPALLASPAVMLYGEVYLPLDFAKKVLDVDAAYNPSTQAAVLSTRASAGSSVSLSSPTNANVPISNPPASSYPMGSPAYPLAVLPMSLSAPELGAKVPQEFDVIGHTAPLVTVNLSMFSLNGTQEALVFGSEVVSDQNGNFRIHADSGNLASGSRINLRIHSVSAQGQFSDEIVKTLFRQ